MRILISQRQLIEQQPKDWLSVCAGKSKLFSGLSHWFMSKSCKENKSIGEEISRLQLAETNLQSAKSTLPSSIQERINILSILSADGR